MPRDRPHGRSAWLWSIHVAFLLVSIALACYLIWTHVPSPWRYLVIAFEAYAVATTPFTLGRMFRAYWNAPLAIAANRGR